MGTSQRSVVWDSVKFDGSLHRSAVAVDLGTTDEGRWLFIPAGTSVSRPFLGDYDHPCDAIALIPPEGLWTATWLVAWDPALYIDLAKLVSIGINRVVTMDLDIDVVRRRSGEVELRDLEEFELHRRQLSYPAELVRTVRLTSEKLVGEVAQQQQPFHVTPNAPPLPRTPDAW